MSLRMTLLPRAFVVYETVVDDDPLRLREIDVARQALVERPIPGLVGATGEPVSATVVAESPRRVEIQASTSQPGLLVLQTPTTRVGQPLSAALL